MASPRCDRTPRQSGQRWRVRCYDAEGRCRSESFDTREDADEFIRAFSARIEVTEAWRRAHELERQADEARTFALSLENRALTVEDVLGRFELALRERRLRPISISGRVTMIRSMCGEILATPLAAVTERQAQELYRQRTQSMVKRGGTIRPLADATHIRELKVTRQLWRYAREQRIVLINPWDAVKPIGRPSHGKEQLTTEEARKLHEVVMRALTGEPVRTNARRTITEGGETIADDRIRALAAGLAFYVGMRTSEITTKLTVRLVSEDGSFIEVRRAKTRKGDRGLSVPPFLAPVLAEARKAAEARGGADAQVLPFRRFWVTYQAYRFCDAAGVPRVCAHALRGLNSTLAIEGGATWEHVVKALGHESDTITRHHYVAPDAAQAANQRSMLRVLAGGKKT